MSGYCTYNNNYCPLGIGTNSGAKVTGMNPIWIFTSDAPITLYLWNLINATITVEDIYITAVSI